jgi:hypothetical protein
MILKDVMTPGVEVIAPEATLQAGRRENAPPEYRSAARL